MPSWGKIIVIGIGAVCAWPSVAGAAVDVKGYVFDSPLGTAVAGAKVLLYSSQDSTVTDGKGWFDFNKPVAVNPAGRDLTAKPMLGWDGSVLSVDWPQARGARVEARLFGLDGRERAPLFAGAWLGAQARFTLPDLAPGVYCLRLQAPGIRHDLPLRAAGGNILATSSAAPLAKAALPVIPIDPVPIDPGPIVLPPIHFTDTVKVAKKGFLQGIYQVTLGDTSRLSLADIAYSGRKKVAGGAGFKTIWVDSIEVTNFAYKGFGGLLLAKAALPIVPIDPAPGLGELFKPVTNITKAEAMLYCNRLSKNAGLDTVYTYASVKWSDTTRTAHAAELVDLAWDSTKAGVRLPSLAEWQRAYAAGASTDYYWGSAFGSGGDYAWYSANSGNGLHAVGGKKPNADTLYDMAGNAAEWVQTTMDYCLDLTPVPGGGCTIKATGDVAAGGGYSAAAAEVKRASYQLVTGGLIGLALRAEDDVGFRTVINAPSISIPCLRCIDPLPVAPVLPSLP